MLLTSATALAEDWLFERVNLCSRSPEFLFTIAHGSAVRPGETVLASFNGILIAGRWFPNVAGCDWLLQPDRIVCFQAQKPAVIGRVLEWRSSAVFPIR
jgi:hypothetical protein